MWNEEAAQALADGCLALNLPQPNAKQREQFALYADFLLEYNQKVNLTAITDPIEIAIKHFLDSLTLFQTGELSPGRSLIDIGTGAGFPGIPLLIMQPQLQLTLLDSLAKRLRFLEELLTKLNLPAELVHSRAEDAARDPKLRGRFRLATARAVSALPTLLEYSLPFLRRDGCFIAQKGPSAYQELEAAQAALRLLGAEHERSIEIRLPLQDDVRVLLVLRQKRATASIYPRSIKQMKEEPLR